jgi:hypothetical protein
LDAKALPIHRPESIQTALILRDLPRFAAEGRLDRGFAPGDTF